MRNFKARLQKLEAKKPPDKRIVRIYWADGTFVGEMSTGTVSVLVQIITTTSVLPKYIWKPQYHEKTYEHDFNSSSLINR